MTEYCFVHSRDWWKNGFIPTYSMNITYEVWWSTDFIWWEKIYFKLSCIYNRRSDKLMLAHNVLIDVFSTASRQNAIGFVFHFHKYIWRNGKKKRSSIFEQIQHSILLRFLLIFTSKLFSRKNSYSLRVVKEVSVSN